MSVDVDHLRPILGEDMFVDYDEDSDMWGVFGVESAFCYDLHLTESEANDRADELRPVPVNG